jgi:catechol 2,3-dioxygenase-like lactoylglutathione lyase family enzyme
MKKNVHTTGDYGIGQMIHVVHMTDDVARLNRFYEKVFGAYVYHGIDEPGYFDVEDRWAALLMVSDLCIETMAPNRPVDPRRPVGKFFTKFGRHLHSVGYKVDDLAGLAGRMIEKGIRIGAPGGGQITEVDPETRYFFPSPRDTAGLMVELCATDMPGEPRNEDTWTSLLNTWRTHPLTIERFSYVTLGVRDLESATKTYVDVMQAVPVERGEDAGLGARYVTLQLGDCLLQLAEALDEDSDLGRHVARWGNMIFSLRFRVRDVDSAEDWLRKNDVRTRRIRPTLLLADPEDTYGAPIYFSSEDIAGDPFR